MGKFIPPTALIHISSPYVSTTGLVSSNISFLSGQVDAVKMWWVGMLWNPLVVQIVSLGTQVLEGLFPLELRSPISPWAVVLLCPLGPISTALTEWMLAGSSLLYQIWCGLLGSSGTPMACLWQVWKWEVLIPEALRFLFLPLEARRHTVRPWKLPASCVSGHSGLAAHHLLYSAHTFLLSSPRRLTFLPTFLRTLENTFL